MKTVNVSESSSMCSGLDKSLTVEIYSLLPAKLHLGLRSVHRFGFFGLFNAHFGLDAMLTGLSNFWPPSILQRTQGAPNFGLLHLP